MLTTFITIAFAGSASAMPLSGNYSLAPISARTSCTAGTVVCNGPTQFGICNTPQPIIWQAVAPGTQCINGQIVPSNVATDASSMGSSSSTAIMASSYGTAPTMALPSSSSTFATVTVSASSTASSTTKTSSAMSSASSSSPASSSSASSAPPTSSLSSSAAASSASAAPAPSASGHYVTYKGDGSTGAGWPAQESWATFDDLFAANREILGSSGSQFDQPNNSPQEISDLKSAILSVSNTTGVDARFIFAVGMQESKLAVRVWTTYYSVANPGLMQSHEGTHSCNAAQASGGVITIPGTAQNPCPLSEIEGMIQDGVAGTTQGPGLQQLLKKADRSDVSQYYLAARWYNSGEASVSASGDLSSSVLAATQAYASDLANRLTLGLIGGASGFSA